MAKNETSHRPSRRLDYALVCGLVVAICAVYSIWAPEPPLWTPFVAFPAVCVTFWLRLLELRDARRADARSSLVGRIEQTRTQMRENAALLEELDEELQARMALLARVVEKHEQYEELVKINEPEADAVRQLIQQEFKRNGRIALGQQMLFFLLGLACGVPLSMFADWLQS